MEKPFQEHRIISSQKALTHLMQLATRAHEKVPFYRTHFEHMSLNTSTSLLTDLPMLDKHMVRSSQKELLCEGYRENQPGTIIEYTSGSTGIPLRLVRTQAEIMQYARKLWYLRVEAFPQVADSLGVLLFPITQNRPQAQTSSLPKKGRVLLSTLDWRIEHIDAYLDELDTLKPSWLSGPPALLSFIAEGLRRTKSRSGLKFAFVESSSDWLAPEVRNRLAESFNCRIINHYGCQETYTIAYECARGAMHLCDDCVVAELHPDKATGENELVVSSLIFETMPFIRYRIGDFVQPDEHPCSCSRTSPVLGQVKGRVSEVIAGTALLGNAVFFQVVTWLAKMGRDDILHYRVYQTAINCFEVHLVLKEKQFLQDIRLHFEEIAAIWLPDAKFLFVAVEHIELMTGGKMQSFVCCV